MKRAWALLVLLLGAGVAISSARAESIPGFERQNCTWHATNIVVVTQGPKLDGKVTVVESWKGGLKKGDRLVVPELEALSRKEARALAPGGKEAATPTHVSGTRLVLYLKRAITDGSDAAAPTDRLEWAPATVYREMSISLAWVEGGKVFAFEQQHNPGDRVLIALDCTEADLKKDALQLVKTQTDLARAMVLPAQAERVEALVAVFRPHLYWEAYDQAVKALRNLGPAALPAFRKLLRDDSLSFHHAEMVATMAGLPGAGRDLTFVLYEELDFWKKASETLKAGWWPNNGYLADGNYLYVHHHSKTLAVLQSLEKLRPDGSKPVVAELRDYWRARPVLQDEKSEVPEACIRVLQALTPPASEKR